MSSIEEIGAYCGALQKRILVSTCPLPKGACMWQHRATKQCAYTHEDLDPSEFCSRVGLPPPPAGEVELRKTKILHELKNCK